MSRYREVNPEVYYPRSERVFVSAMDIDALTRQASDNPRRRSRLCLHPDPVATVHEMVIIHERGCYVRPHRHVFKAESLLVLEGEALAVFFNDAGGVEEVMPLGGPSSGRTFYYRLPAGQWHTLLINSERLVFIEVSQGPFNPSQSDFAAWAPDGADEEEARSYMESVVQQVRSFLPSCRESEA